MSDLVAIGLGAVVGAAAAALAQRGDSYYHDAVRPLARDLRSGATGRAELSTYAWGVSWRFMAFFALPFGLLTGAVVAHLLFLPAEVLAIRLGRLAAAAAAGAALGAAAVGLTIGLHDVLDGPALGLAEHAAALVEPVRWLYPLVPVVAALKLPRPAVGTAATAAAAALAGGVTALAGADAEAGAAAAAAGAVTVIAFHLARSRAGAVAALPALAERGTHVRRGLPLLLLAGAAVAGLAAEGRLAGDPLAAVLIASGHELDAAAIALLIGLAFLPAVAVSTVAADSYSTQGTPDVIPAAGYLLTTAPVAALPAGALLMAGEIGLRRRMVRLVMARPIVSELASALRDAIGDVALLALTVGGLVLAGAVGGSVGFAAAGAAWLANEQCGRPVTRLAVTPAAALLVAVAAEAWRAIT